MSGTTGLSTVSSNTHKLQYIRHLNQYITEVHSIEYGHHYIARCDISVGALIDWCQPTYCTNNTYANEKDNNLSYIKCVHELAHDVLQYPYKYGYLSPNNHHHHHHQQQQQQQQTHNDVQLQYKPAVIPPPTDLMQYTSDQWSTAISLVQTNSISIYSTSASDEYSMCIYNKLSLYNHSCQPNLCIYYNTTTTNTNIHQSGSDNNNNNIAYVYALQPIRQSDQLYICYRTDLLHLPTHKRQSILYNTWRFICRCILCTCISHTQNIIESDQQYRLLSHQTQYINTMESLVNQLIEQGNQYIPPAAWLSDIDELLLHNHTLHYAHYILHSCRWNIMPVLLGAIQSELSNISSSDTTNNNTNKLQYIKQWRNKLLKILTIHIDSTILIEPSLHSHKLQLYNTYIYIANQLLGLPINIVCSSLHKLDPSYQRVIDMYTSDTAIKLQNDMIRHNQLQLD